MKKRNKIPVATALGELADRSHFKGKSRNPLRGWWRPRISSTLVPLTFKPTRPIGR